MAETVSIRVTQSGAKETAASISEVADSITDVEKASKETAKALRESGAATQEQASALRDTGSAAGSAFRVIKNSIIVWSLATTAIAAYRHGLLQATRVLQKNFTAELRGLGKLFERVNFGAGVRGVAILMNAIDALFSLMRSGIRITQFAWVQGMRAMMSSNSTFVRSAGFLFASFFTTLKASVNEVIARLALLFSARLGQIRAFGRTIMEHAVRPFRRFFNAIGGARRGLNRFITTTRALMIVVAGLTALIVGGLVAKGLVSLAKSGAALVPVQRAFESLSGHVGTTAELMRNDLRQATLGTVSDLSLMRSSVLALNSGAIKTRAELAAVARAAQVLGQTVGLDTATAFDNLVRGIGLVNPQLIKSVGVLVSANDAYREYAQTIGKSIGALDDHERKEAFRIVVMAKLEGAVSRVDAEQISLLNSLQQASAAGQNWTNVIRGQVAESERLGGFVRGMTFSLVRWSQILNDNAGIVTALTDGFFELGLIIATMTPILNFFTTRAVLAGDELQEMTAQVSAMAAAGRAFALVKDDAFRDIIPVDELLRIGRLNQEMQQLSQQLFDDDTEETRAALEAAIVQLTIAVDQAERLRDTTREVSDLWANMPRAIDIGSSSVATFASGVESTKKAIEAATIQAQLLKLEFDATSDPTRRQALAESWREVARQLEQSQLHLGFYTGQLDDALVIAGQQVGVWDAQIAAQAAAAVQLEDIVQLGRELETVELSVVDRILQQADALKEVFRERKRLAEVIRGTDPAFFAPGGRPSDILGGFQGAGISPGLAGFSAQAGGVGGLGAALADLAKLQAVQAEWAAVLEGDTAALQALVDAGHITDAEMKELALTLGNVSNQTDVVAAAMVTALGGALQAMVSGTENAAAAIIRTASQIAQIALVSAGHPVFGALAGVAGGLLGSIFGNRNKPQPVEIANFSDRALGQQRNLNQGPTTVVVQFVDPRTGAITEEQRTALLRLERRDAVSRLPMQVSG